MVNFSASHDTLKAKQRQIRESFPAPLAQRVHRAISWLGRAEREVDDLDVRFILLWIGFNSTYAADLASDVGGERAAFRSFFEPLVDFDLENRIYNAVGTRFPHEIRLLLSNRYVFAPFWSYHNGAVDAADWEQRLEASKKVIASALSARDTARILTVVFDRLYVLRNQLVHGGATWNSGVNRDQVRDGAKVLGWLLPIFIDLVMDHPGRDLGRPFYPVVE